MKASPRKRGANRYAAGGRRLAALLAGLGLAVSGAHADDAFVDPLPPPAAFAFEPSRPVSNDDPDTDIARFGLDAAPWVGQVIAEMNETRGGGHTPEQIMLIEGGDDQLYLVVTWGRDFRRWIEFHRATELGDGRVLLEFMRQLEAKTGYEIWSQTGSPLFPGEPPVVVVYTENGSSRCAQRLLLFQLRQNTVDITPGTYRQPLRALADLDDDGTYEAILLDGTLGEDCSLWDGAIPIIMRRADGQFVNACADFKAYFAFWRNWFSDHGLFPEPSLRRLFAETREALVLAQVGSVDAGIAHMRAALADPTTVPEEDITRWHGWLTRFPVPAAHSVPITKLLELARTLSPAGCPTTEAAGLIAAELAAGPPAGHPASSHRPE